MHLESNLTRGVALQGQTKQWTKEKGQKKQWYTKYYTEYLRLCITTS